MELNDGALPGSPLYDPARARRFCGEGDFDIKGLIQVLRNMGYTGPWAALGRRYLVDKFPNPAVGIESGLR